MQQHSRRLAFSIRPKCSKLKRDSVHAANRMRVWLDATHLPRTAGSWRHRDVPGDADDVANQQAQYCTGRHLPGHRPATVRTLGHALCHGACMMVSRRQQSAPQLQTVGRRCAAGHAAGMSQQLDCGAAMPGPGERQCSASSARCSAGITRLQRGVAEGVPQRPRVADRVIRRELLRPSHHIE